jgi:hypothetical protein
MAKVLLEMAEVRTNGLVNPFQTGNHVPYNGLELEAHLQRLPRGTTCLKCRAEEL